MIPDFLFPSSTREKKPQNTGKILSICFFFHKTIQFIADETTKSQTNSLKTVLVHVWHLRTLDSDHIYFERVRTYPKPIRCQSFFPYLSFFSINCILRTRLLNTVLQTVSKQKAALPSQHGKRSTDCFQNGNWSQFFWQTTAKDWNRKIAIALSRPAWSKCFHFHMSRAKHIHPLVEWVERGSKRDKCTLWDQYKHQVNMREELVVSWTCPRWKRNTSVALSSFTILPIESHVTGQHFAFLSQLYHWSNKPFPRKILTPQRGETKA